MVANFNCSNGPTQSSQNGSITVSSGPDKPLSVKCLILLQPGRYPQIHGPIVANGDEAERLFVTPPPQKETMKKKKKNKKKGHTVGGVMINRVRIDSPVLPSRVVCNTDPVPLNLGATKLAEVVARSADGFQIGIFVQQHPSTVG